MKKYYLTSIFTAIIITYSLSYTAYCEVNEQIQLNAEEKMKRNPHSLSLVRGIHPSHISQEANKYIVKPPEKVLEESEAKIKSIIKKEWLPVDLKNSFVAYKDFVQYKNNMATEKGDYLIAEYNVNNNNILLEENGVGLTFRVYTAKKLDLSIGVTNIIKQNLLKYFNYPTNKIDHLNYKIYKKTTDEIFNGYSYYYKRCPRITNEFGGVKYFILNWWDRIGFATDGNFLMFDLHNLGNNELSRPRRTPGYTPDRF
jgi:hypothetical protein